MRRCALLVAGLALLAGATAVVSGGATQAEARWVITDLGTLGGKESYAAAINSRGQVVGWVETKKGRTHPSLWRKGRMTDLGALGYKHAWATGINGRDQVIGRVLTVGGDEDFGVETAPRAFTWERGAATELWGEHDHFADDAAYSQVLAINEDGQMVGWADDERDSEAHAYLWQVPPGHAAHYLTGLDLSRRTQYGVAYDINEQGQAVGEARRTFRLPIHAALWENGKLTDLGTLGGKASFARAINDKSQVIGRSQVVGGRWRAFLWENGKIRGLGTLPGWPHSSAIALNERGQVVGWTSKTWRNDSSAYGDDVLPPKPRAFIWEDGKLRDLGTLGGKHSIPFAINDSGQVVGQSQIANGQWHAFVWQEGVMTRLPTLGGKYGAALALNDAGQIVGWGRTPEDVKHAVLWTLKR